MKTPFEIYRKTRREHPIIHIIKFELKLLDEQTDPEVRSYYIKKINKYLDEIEKEIKDLY